MREPPERTTENEAFSLMFLEREAVYFARATATSSSETSFSTVVLALEGRANACTAKTATK